MSVLSPNAESICPKELPNMPPQSFTLRSVQCAVWALMWDKNRKIGRSNRKTFTLRSAQCAVWVSVFSPNANSFCPKALPQMPPKASHSTSTPDKDPGLASISENLSTLKTTFTLRSAQSGCRFYPQMLKVSAPKRSQTCPPKPSNCAVRSLGVGFILKC